MVEKIEQVGVAPPLSDVECARAWHSHLPPLPYALSLL